METYYEIGQRVRQAVERGQGMRVELDPGVLELWGTDLLEQWEAIAPGEAFVVLEVLDPGAGHPESAAGPSPVPAVTVYSTPRCPQCAATIRALDKRGASYDVVDLSADAEAHEYVTKTLGYHTAPVVEVAGRHWCGYRPDLIKTLVTDQT